MYLPKRKQKPRSNPFKVQYSVRFLWASGALVLMASVVSLTYAIREVQKRDRRSLQEVRLHRPGQRVVIIGAGAGGAALAASLCNAAPDVHVTVIEKDRKQTFMAAYPVANVGHRSYDINTSGGVDFLRSPAAWNVTRDANLVGGEVTKVLTATQEVVVTPTQGTAATFSSPASSESDGKDNKKDAPYRSLSDGQQAYPYDVLVVACGAKRALGPLEGILPHGLGDIDCYGIAVNPGITRDSLGHLFQGNVVQVKVPPKSFYALMEAERKVRQQQQREPAVLVYEGRHRSSHDGSHDEGFLSVMARLSALKGAHEGPAPAALVLHPYMYATSRQHDSTFASTVNTLWKYLDYFNKFSHCQLIAVTADAEPLGPAPECTNNAVLDFWLARWKRSCLTRTTAMARDDSTLLTATGNSALVEEGKEIVAASNAAYVVQMPGSKEKTIVVQLPTEDQATSKTVVERATEGEERKEGAPTEPTKAPRFHFLNNSYLTAIDPDKQIVTLYNHIHNVLLTLPYRLLLLDLPLKAPAFVRESGLARDRYAEENAPATLRPTQRAMKDDSSVVSVEAVPLLSQCRWWWPLSWSAKAAALSHSALVDAFEDDSSFIDVDAATLQHRRYTNIFALGDVAGLPSEKGYGATLAQVPVVSHNVLQVMADQRARLRLAAETEKASEELKHKKGENKKGEGAAMEWYKLRTANARYDGYASYHVVMSTWRAMWPEMAYSDAVARALGVPIDNCHGAVASEPTAEKDPAPSPQQALEDGSVHLSRRLAFRDNHLWSSLAWRDLRGLGNGAFHQFAVYETAYFFLSTRGVWYPPGGFSVPTFSVVDGSVETAKRSRFL